MVFHVSGSESRAYGDHVRQVQVSTGITAPCLGKVPDPKSAPGTLTNCSYSFHQSDVSLKGMIDDGLSDRV